MARNNNLQQQSCGSVPPPPAFPRRTASAPQESLESMALTGLVGLTRSLSLPLPWAQSEFPPGTPLVEILDAALALTVDDGLLTGDGDPDASTVEMTLLGNRRHVRGADSTVPRRPRHAPSENKSSSPNPQ